MMMMMLWVSLAPVVALLTVGSADSPDCKPCLAEEKCPSNDCKLHCYVTCPEGYASASLADSIISICETPPAQRDPTLPPTQIVTTTLPSNPSTQTQNPVTSPRPRDFECYKCQVDNCLACPADDLRNCTACLDGFDLEATDPQTPTRCMRETTTTPPDTGSHGEKGEEDGGGGGSGSSGSSGGSSVSGAALGGGVAAALVVVLGGAALLVFILWRRRRVDLRKDSNVELAMKKAYKKKRYSEDEDSTMDPRYTRSPTSVNQEAPSGISNQDEINEVDKLPEAPAPPTQPNYDTLQVDRQASVQPYGELEMQDNVYGNMTILQQTNQKPGDRTYANQHLTTPAPATVTSEDDGGPSEIYGNDDILHSQGQGLTQDQEYMDMTSATRENSFRSGNVQGPQQDDVYLNDQPSTLNPRGRFPSHRETPGPVATEDDVYLNDAETGRLPGVAGATQDDVYLNDAETGRLSGLAGTTEDDVYLNDAETGRLPGLAGVTEDDVYLNDAETGRAGGLVVGGAGQGEFTQDDVYLNQPIEENVYGNT